MRCASARTARRPSSSSWAGPTRRARPHGTTGLFHLAILLPSRADLARALRRVADAGWRFTGASDHLVSEALYLHDPEGNGIEIYRDRPREQWRFVDGELQMDTLPLDLDSVLGELSGADTEANGMPAGTRIGHVHLNVAELSAAEDFYAGALGFDVTVRSYPGALFFSTGGYHHQIGVNTWAGRERRRRHPARSGCAGSSSRSQARPSSSRWNGASAPPGSIRSATGTALLVADPSGNGILLRGGRFARTGLGDPTNVLGWPNFER